MKPRREVWNCNVMHGIVLFLRQTFQNDRNANILGHVFDCITAHSSIFNFTWRILLIQIVVMSPALMSEIFVILLIVWLLL